MGSALWKVGASTEVRLVNDEFVSKNSGTTVAIKDLNSNSVAVGMNEPELNARAFLSMIRKGEGTSGNDGYKTQFGGKQFSDFKDHPNEVVKKGGYSSSAAGAYQVLSKTWKGAASAKENLGIKDFSPESQDKMGLWLLKNRDALDEVMQGDVEGAILKTNKEWASLPGSPYGQPTQTMKGAMGEFKKAVSNELKGRSDIATPKGKLEETIKKLE